MKVATWNIPYAFRPASHSEAWEYYLNQVQADYYLAQEVRPPDWLYDDHDVVWAQIERRGEWGSCIVSPTTNLREIEINTEFRGTFIIAETTLPSGFELTLISLYGLFEKIGDAEYIRPNLHRMLSDLTGLLDGKTHGARNVILGGDLNASLQWGDKHRIFFERLEGFGLTNCYDSFYDDYVQTYRHSTSGRNWQNDYLFISDGLADNLQSCEVLDTEEVRKFSDHNPVVVTTDTV